MERTQLFDLMGELKLYGMKAATMRSRPPRQHEPQRVVRDLLNAEISEKQARPVRYQLTIAKLRPAKDLDNFEFQGTPINATLVNDLAGGGFIAQQRRVVLAAPGPGKTHLPIAIVRNCIGSGARGRFYNVVDLVNRLETETRSGRQGRIADYLTRPDFLETIEEMQAVLDSYMDGYNNRRLHQGRGMNGRTPAVAFVEGLPKPHRQKEEKRPEKNQPHKPPDAARSPRLCQPITLSVQSVPSIAQL